MSGNISSGTTHTQQLSHTEGTAMQDELHVYILPIVVIVGSISNILTLIVFLKGKQQGLSVSYYFCVYSVTNLLSLFATYGLHWLSMVSNFKGIDSTNGYFCPIWQFVYRIINYSGVWIVLAVTIDRYIAVCQPHHASTMCSVFMAKVATIIIYTGVIVVSVHAMWTYEISEKTDWMCNVIQGLHVDIWRWLSASCYTFIPLVLLLLFDIMLICGLCMKNGRSNVSRQECVPTDLKYTVLALSNVYLMLACPATIVNIIHITMPSTKVYDQAFMYRFDIIMSVFDILTFGNPVMPVFVCVIFSKTFRQELQQMFSALLRRKNRRRNHELKAVSTGSGIQLDAENCIDNTLV